MSRCRTHDTSGIFYNFRMKVFKQENRIRRHDKLRKYRENIWEGTKIQLDENIAWLNDMMERTSECTLHDYT